jgi:hypothetical protein
VGEDKLLKPCAIFYLNIAAFTVAVFHRQLDSLPVGEPRRAGLSAFISRLYWLVILSRSWKASLNWNLPICIVDTMVCVNRIGALRIFNP